MPSNGEQYLSKNIVRSERGGERVLVNIDLKGLVIFVRVQCTLQDSLSPLSLFTIATLSPEKLRPMAKQKSIT